MEVHGSLQVLPIQVIEEIWQSSSVAIYVIYQWSIVRLSSLGAMASGVC